MRETASCFAGDGAVRLASGGTKLARDVAVGDMLATPHGRATPVDPHAHTMPYVLHSSCSTLALCRLPDCAQRFPFVLIVCARFEVGVATTTK